MALKFIDYGTPQYKEMIELRKMILRDPLGLKFIETELEREKDDILLGSFDDDVLEGCCLLTETKKDTVRLRQMAVLDGLQGKGIGKALMLFAENVARDAGYKNISMHARASAIGFYEKLGYHITGNEFLEVTIPHYEMEKEI